MEYPNRKHPRLKGYDYSQSGAYFVTICTKDRQPILCDVIAVGRDDLGTPEYIMKLTSNGEIADKYINSISKHYENVFVDKYVIMPDHIHILLTITEPVGRDDSTRRESESSHPTVSQIVGVMKRLINREIGRNIFQTSFNDHIIRDENDYRVRWNYIENNPAKWIEREGDHK